jgi:desulfoferrodoxin (superoxide reductase-like protein)
MEKKSFLVVILVLFVFTSTALADKTAVTIQAPQSVKKGTEITIKISATHSGNNSFHYTNWVYVHANGKEIARWDFSSKNRPESNNFTEEVNYTVNEKTEITAKGNCNIHGSAGEVNMVIDIE